MPRRLLREPHVLAHELRTPLAVLAGWYSLVRDADISPDGTPAEWARAMAACQDATDTGEAAHKRVNGRRRMKPRPISGHTVTPP